MIPKAFKACFKALFKLYDDFMADYESIIGEKEKTLLFINAFPADHHDAFGQQQEQYCKMIMDDFAEFFQTCYSTDLPLCKQCRCQKCEQ